MTSPLSTPVKCDSPGDRGASEIVGAGLVPARLVEHMGSTMRRQLHGGQRHGGQPQGLPLRQYMYGSAVIGVAGRVQGATVCSNGQG